MKTAVIYARYSCDSQSEQSIEGQLRVCKDYAKRNDIVIADIYIDRAMTGTNDKREAFQKMIKDSEKRQWSIVLVYKLDRFSRNKYESVIYKKALRDNGVKIISAMESIPDTPEGILMESVLEGFNQYFSEELRQKVNRGLRESWLKGNATGGKHIFGYDIVNKKYVVNEYERQIIVTVFNKYAQGYKAREIAEDLNAQGFHKNGKPFTEKYMYTLLHDMRYTGKVEHQGEVYTNIFPAIVDEKTWKLVDAINQNNKLSPASQKAKFNYILTGKLICGLCNRKMSGESGTSAHSGSYYYYVCSKHRSKTNPCSTKAVSKEWLENTVIDILQNTLYSESNIAVITENVYYFLQNKAHDDTSLKLLEKEKKHIIKGIQNIVKSIEQGIISDFTKGRLAELESALADIEIKITKEKNRNYAYLTKDAIESFIRSHLLENLNDIKVRKALINALVKEIRLFPDKIIVIFNVTDKGVKDKLTLEENIATAGQITSALNSPDSSFILPQSAPRNRIVV